MVPVETHCLHRNHLTRSDMSALSRKFLSTSLLANPRGTQLGRRRPQFDDGGTSVMCRSRCH